MTSNNDKLDNAIVKIVANHTREYNELDKLYKKLGVKHLTLMEVHKITLEKMAKMESQHHSLKEEHAILVNRFVDVRIVCSNQKAEIKKQRADIVEDLCNLQGFGGLPLVYEPINTLKEKWEAKQL